MIDEPQGIPLADARAAAQIIRGAMRCRCAVDQDGKDLIQIAGSIRRCKERVKDIEVVAVPAWYREPDPSDLLQERHFERNRLFREWAIVQTAIQWIKPSVPGIEPWYVQETGRYWRGYIASLTQFGELAHHEDPLPDVAVKIDIFLAGRSNYGTILLIRTGSADFSSEVMTHALRVGYQVRHGNLWRVRGKVEPVLIPTPTEADVFRELNLRWVHPTNRRSADDVRAGWNEQRYQQHLAGQENGQSSAFFQGKK